jgi:hypothetical protein
MPIKPTEKEEEYFARLEYEKKRKAQMERRARQNDEEREQLRKLHYMHCPKCGQNLIEIDYKGVAVDKCSGCEGIWLDPGELEQIAQFEKGGLDKWFTVFRR